MSDEFDFLAALRTLPLHAGADGLRDDAAVIAFGGEALVLTHDMIAEGVHYLPGTDPFDIAWKLVAVNLSDLAAKGAEPIGVMIGASLIDRSERFVEGLRAILSAYDVPLIGGDTIRQQGPASFGCTAIGRATTQPVPRRTSARPGDRLYVVGELGEAWLGYTQCKHGTDRNSTAVEAYLRPRPLLAEGIALAPLATAMMDVSDGLLLDAQRMADASGVTIGIFSEAVPLPAALWEDGAGRDLSPNQIQAERWRDVATWGDDYALLIATPHLLETSTIPNSFVGLVGPRGEHALLVDGAAPDYPLGYSHQS